MLQLLGSGVQEEQERRHVHNMAVQLGRVLESTSSENKEKVVQAINNVMTNISKNDLKYASDVIREMKKMYHEIDSQYPFELKL